MQLTWQVLYSEFGVFPFRLKPFNLIPIPQSYD